MLESGDNAVSGSDGVRLEVVLREAALLLKQGGVEQPKLTAQLLLSHLLGIDRVHLIARGEDPMAAEINRRYLALVRRCMEGEPLQYITGEKEFYGRRFRVTREVLIPRPETEILVEKAVLLANAGSDHQAGWVDVGTGSGCIAVSLASELSGTEGWAVDSSHEALLVALGNAKEHEVLDRVRFVCGDILQCFPPKPLFDLILCNPPYVSAGDLVNLDRRVRDFEPHAALFSGDSGFEFFERLLPQAYRRLRAGGFLLMEVGMGQSDQVAALSEGEGFVIDEILNDLQGIPRCMVAHKQSEKR